MKTASKIKLTVALIVTRAERYKHLPTFLVMFKIPTYINHDR